MKVNFGMEKSIILVVNWFVISDSIDGVSEARNSSGVPASGISTSIDRS